MVTRRTLLRSLPATPLAAGLAGCQNQRPPTASGESDQNPPPDYGPELAAAAQLTTYRARLGDAVALGNADRHGLGATVAAEAFQAFERANGEYGVHTVLENADPAAYEGFEQAAVAVRTGLESGDEHAAGDALDDVRDHLRSATIALVGEDAANALDVLSLGTRTATAAVFAAAAEPRVGATIANGVLTDLDATPAMVALQATDDAAATRFEDAIRAILRAGQQERASAIRTGSVDVLERATTGASMLAPTPAAVGTVASLQGQVHDAHLLARLGGPGRGYAHAVVLTTYRARVQDVARLVDSGAHDAAAAAAIAVLQAFEESRAHEPLESAAHDAYVTFEEGVVDLESQAAGGDTNAVRETIENVDEALRAGIVALAPTNAAILEAGFLHARLADARERFLAGDQAAASSVAREVFARFERDELGVHEALEDQSTALYERFEHEHLEPLPAALTAGDAAAVDDHVMGARDALLEFEANAGGTALVSGAEASVAAATGFDAATSAAIGDRDRAAELAAGGFETFEAGAGGFHDALERGDHAVYETFEERFVGVRRAAESGDDVFAAASGLQSAALDAAYAVVDSAGGELGPLAAALARDATARFRESDAKAMLAEDHRDVAEAVDTAFTDLQTALSEGRGVEAAVDSATTASRRAQFALVGALAAAPTQTEGDAGDAARSYTGGPNVVEGVPDDADHVVQMTPTTFEPADLTVSPGDTVAFAFEGGEPHTVTAYPDRIPAGVTYWASGGFDSHEAAVEGWEDEAGAIVEGESYVHTFETPGEHHYYCIPHEALGMTGAVVVEE